jgi:hypothetical protein
MASIGARLKGSTSDASEWLGDARAGAAVVGHGIHRPGDWPANRLSEQRFTTTAGVPAAISMTTIGADPSRIVNFIAKHDTLYADVGSLLKAAKRPCGTT